MNEPAYVRVQLFFEATDAHPVYVNPRQYTLAELPVIIDNWFGSHPGGKVEILAVQHRNMPI